MARPGKLIAGIALAVLLAHVAVLQWLDSQWRKPSVLRPLATPMLTRQIVPQAPATPPVVAAKPPPAKPAPVMSSLPLNATPTLPDPLPALPEPTPTVAAVTPTLTVAASSPLTSSTATATSTVSHLDAWPADTRLTYKLGGNFRGPLSGDAQVQWLREEERYEVRIDINVSILASMLMTSQGEILPQGLFPHAYEEVSRANTRSVFLGPSEVFFTNGTKVPRPPGLQDTASQFVELTQHFASGRAVLEVGKQVSFPMARPGGVDFWTYDITEKVMLDTPRMGPVEAFHLKPRPLVNPRGNITAEMWFAPSLQYLPVRIRINMGPETHVDLLVEKIEQK